MAKNTLWTVYDMRDKIVYPQEIYFTRAEARKTLKFYKEIFPKDGDKLIVCKLSFKLVKC